VQERKNVLETWWRRPRKRRQAAFAIGGGVTLLALIGAVAYSNVVERQSLASSGLAAGSTLTTAGGATGAAGPAEAASRGEWLSFVGKGLSLELPAWFQGGMPSDEDARAAFEELVGMDLDEWLALYAGSSLEQGEVELLMAGALGVEGELIVVAAEVHELPPGSSLEEYVHELAAWLGGGELSVEMITEDRAVCRFDFRRADDPARAMASRVVLVSWGGEVHAVSYTATVESSRTLDSVFDASAATIVIME
jgi:hypothetical protein